MSKCKEDYRPVINSTKRFAKLCSRIPESEDGIFERGRRQDQQQNTEEK